MGRDITDPTLKKLFQKNINFPEKENYMEGGIGGRPANQNMCCSPLVPPLPKLHHFPALIGPKKSSGLTFTSLYIKSYPPWKSFEVPKDTHHSLPEQKKGGVLKLQRQALFRVFIR